MSARNGRARRCAPARRAPCRRAPHRRWPPGRASTVAGEPTPTASAIAATSELGLRQTRPVREEDSAAVGLVGRLRPSTTPRSGATTIRPASCSPARRPPRHGVQQAGGHDHQVVGGQPERADERGVEVGDRLAVLREHRRRSRVTGRRRRQPAQREQCVVDQRDHDVTRREVARAAVRRRVTTTADSWPSRSMYSTSAASPSCRRSSARSSRRPTARGSPGRHAGHRR